VLGVLSLIFWALTAVVSFKYVLFILRADNRGEGGIFALLALLPHGRAGGSAVAVVAALFGAALLYGDGIITPAISVLSAVEGLGVATDALSSFVVPITVALLMGLFAFQHHGTAGIGKVFGPVMLLWFLSLAALGVLNIAEHPAVLAALSPTWAITFFRDNGLHGVLVLGSVVLAITGAEALYADLGHFGRRPIRTAWFVVAFPALLLNYFGQGALLLDHPEWASNPFYAMVPRPLLYPMVALATAATIIASQALITGVFSLTSQAVQMGFLPRVHVIHTSGEAAGQIFLPSVNRFLMVACIALVITFQHSSNLAAAYGVAVTANMGITSLLFFFVAIRTWKWSLAKALPLLALFLFFDLSFFGANLLKVADGGWFPLVIAVGLLVLMLTWRDGRAELRRHMKERALPQELFVEDVLRRQPTRVPGTAVFMSSAVGGTPVALLHHYKHNKVLHEKIVFLAVRSEDRPFVDPGDRVEVQELGGGFYRMLAHYGFMERPDVPEALRLAEAKGLVTDPAQASYFLGRETLLTTGKSPMQRWRKALFALMSRNAEPASNWFGLPPGRVVELGMQIEL
jgi:KUP system potassium uptake protein